MALSSNSLFHFTKELKSLVSILNDGFKASYCLEQEFAIPMVSFCDVPLGQAKFHLDNYGQFAIGMKNSWAVENQLNPVLYIEDNSIMKARLDEALTSLSVDNNLDKWDDQVVKEYESMFQVFLQVIKLSKPYSGKLRRGKSSIENYKYYNEKEWRYIHKPLELQILNFDEYEKYREVNFRKPHFHKDPLAIKANDINYIIVENEDHIPVLLKELMNCQFLGSAGEVQLLTTRILTSKQIREDF